MERRSQCGGQGFEPPLLHHLFSTIYSHRQRWLFWPSGQYVKVFNSQHAAKFLFLPMLTTT